MSFKTIHTNLRFSQKKLMAVAPIRAGLVAMLSILLLTSHTYVPTVFAEGNGTPATSAFTFQGQLRNNGAAVNNGCNFTFTLWDSESGGTRQGNAQSANAIHVAGGFFTVQLDFGNHFKGDARWLEVSAQCAGDPAAIRMDKRILLTSSPYAIGLMPGAEITTLGERGLTVNANGNAVVAYGRKDGYATIFAEDQSAAGGFGLYGISNKGMGVYGKSTASSGVRGVSDGEFQAGVVGIHNGNGTGVYGVSKGAGVFGKSEDWIGVYGESTNYQALSGKSSNNVAVYGVSDKSDAIFGVSKGVGKAGVVGVSESDGIGVFGLGKNGGTGVYGRSENNEDFAIYADGKMGGKVIHILGGADLAEWYNVSMPSEPGTLMVIDAENPGKLKPSSSAYDSKVAGVVSGAGGVNPGMTLQQTGVLDGDTQVAIAGRVYVKASVINGAIQPGDLLTSSSIPGHVMKATDRELAYGSVIGKAMSELSSGEGLVLVLVNLQ